MYFPNIFDHKSLYLRNAYEYLIIYKIQFGKYWLSFTHFFMVHVLS